MALHSDSVGLVVAGRKPNGNVGWWTKCYEPVDGRIDHRAVFAEIAGTIATRWQVKGVTYDPRFFELPARDLEDQGIRAVEFPQVLERLVPADGLLYELVKNHELEHLGDPTLNAHAMAAAWRETDRGRYLSKGLSAGHMDLIRAGSMATWELLAGEPEASPLKPLVAST